MIKKCDNTSVGVIIRKKGKILLIKRKLFPFGFAPPAGHVDGKGSYENAAKEEVREETGLRTIALKQIIEGKKDNKCRRRNGNFHYWKIYEAIGRGVLKPSKRETRQAKWFSLEEIKKLAKITKKYIKGEITDTNWQRNPGLEVVWANWFEELEIT